LNESTLEERLVLAAITRDAAAAKELLPVAIEPRRKTPSQAARSEAERSMRALAALAEGKAQESATLLEPVTFDAAHSEVVQIWSLAKLDSGDPAAAIKGFEFTLSRESRRSISALEAHALVSLGRAKAAMGQTADARSAYERFFALWKDADPDLPLLVEARQEFSKLGS
jgi:hypothetical protein